MGRHGKQTPEELEAIRRREEAQAKADEFDRKQRELDAAAKKQTTDERIAALKQLNSELNKKRKS